MPEHKRITVITGHYGTGKTNLSINLSLEYARAGESVTLVDMDLVNPYFRTSDFREEIETLGKGVTVLAPAYARTTLDMPAVLPEVMSVFESRDTVIFDVGGDDAGARALGRYFKNFNDIDYDMLYVVNMYRALTTEAGEAAELLREIEAASRLRATGIVNNSHLKQATTAADIVKSVEFAEKVAEITGAPLMFTTAPRHIAKEVQKAVGDMQILPVDVYVRTPWE
jgi:CO dehydrogenase nickel-insertion accessory protein CooC1